VVGAWRHGKARERGLKRIQFEPHLSVTGAASAEWVPIRPKTDAAFLFSLVHVAAARDAARRSTSNSSSTTPARPI
jgi:phenylacetyl-CoA:acceptor oxidoreductase